MDDVKRLQREGYAASYWGNQPGEGCWRIAEPLTERVDLKGLALIR
jgi:hypothetical protein